MHGRLKVNRFLSFISADANIRTVNATLIFFPLDREACTLVTVTDHDVMGLPDGFVVVISGDNIDIVLPPILITINDNDDEGGQYNGLL